MPVPTTRLRRLNERPVRPDAAFVLYWMVANRRLGMSFALDRALEWAVELRRPLVILEALRVDYPHASDRLHAFVLDGMLDNLDAAAGAPITYVPWVEPRPGAGRGLLVALARQAALVVTDDYPAFFIPGMLAAAAERLPVRLEAVDANGLLPMRLAPQVFTTAHSFRRFLHRTLPAHLLALPKARPFGRLELPRLRALPSAVLSRWRPADAGALRALRQNLDRLPIDHTVPPASVEGGSGAAHRALRAFLRSKLQRYAEDRNHPDHDAASGLSPWLHFGHLSTAEVAFAVLRAEKWTPDALNPGAKGAREGFWGTRPCAESFLNQIITWRELGFNRAALEPPMTAWDSLPRWARAALSRHASDPRPYRYDRRTLEAAQTHDPIWNAAQRELTTTGRMQNYLRMLWGKKILEWSASPKAALDVMVELNDRWALDGRDPNSLTGILWCLGRYDRPWAPERPIFGTVRYMSSENTRRKLKLKEYLARFGADASLRGHHPT